MPYKNIYAVTKPMIYLLITAGVCTISPKTYKLSYLVTFFTGTLAILNLSHVIFVPLGIIYIEKRNNNRDDTDLSSQHFVSKMINPVLISLVALSTRIFILFKIDKFYLQFLRSINTVDKILGNSPNLNDFKMVTLIICWIFVTSFPFQIYSVSKIVHGLSDCAIFAVNFFNNFSTVCFEMLFVSLAFTAKKRFLLIHEKLKRLGGSLTIDQYLLIDKNYLVGNIGILKESHFITYQICDRLEETFSLPLFILLSNLAVNVLLNLYFAIFGGFRPTSSKIEIQPIASIINSLMWSLHYFLRFLIICAAADNLSREGNKSKIYVSNLLRAQMSLQIKDEMNNFLNYTLSRKIKFMAGGFFKIDFTLVTTAVATGTTYLVILAQFQKG